MGGLGRVNPVPKPKKIKKVSKVEEWNRVRRELVQEFKDRNITSCELGLEGCQRNNFLTFAHTVKRRYVTDLKRVVLACVLCHSKIEYDSIKWTGLKMEEYLEGIIKNR